MAVEFRTTAQGALEDFQLAAAVVLTRGSGSEREVYVVRRSPELRAFPNQWAFPGGRVDAGDGDPRSGDLEAFRACALRELFEETGVAGPGIAGAFESRTEREGLRRLLTDDERSRGSEGAAAWRALLGRCAEPLAELAPICWTTTPRFALRRFRALYVQLELPAGERPEVVPGELVDGRFARPTELLAEWRRGELEAVPPLVFLLEAAERHDGDFEAAMRSADERSAAVDAGALHAVFQMPGFEVAPLLTPTLPPATTTNCVVVGTERLFVVDPATYDGAERQRLVEHLERRAESAQLAGVVVTHHHHDHVGSVAAVAEHFELPVFAHPRTLERLPEPVGDARPLAHGDRLALGHAPDGTPGWSLEALHTPGHDQGHVVLRDSRYRTIVAGDLVSTLSTIVIDPPEGHLATYLATLERIRDAEPGALIPAHGSIAYDGRRLLEGYLRHRAQREAKLVAALTELGPADEAALLARTYDDIHESFLPLAARSLRAGLEKLAEDGRARADEGGRWAVA